MNVLVNLFNVTESIHKEQKMGQNQVTLHSESSWQKIRRGEW